MTQAQTPEIPMIDLETDQLAKHAEQWDYLKYPFLHDVEVSKYRGV